MSEESKLDLLIEQMSLLNSSVQELKKGQIESNNKINALDSKVSESNNKINALDSKVSELASQTSILQEQVARNNILLEHEIIPKLDIMIEAQKVYEERFPSVQQLKTDVELLKVDRDVTKAALSDCKREIEKLKIS